MIKTKNKPNGFVVLIGLFVLGLAIFSFSTKNSDASEPEYKNTSTIEVSSNYQVVNGLDEMVNTTGVVVVGSFDKQIDTMNMRRDSKDITKENKVSYEEGRVYEFIVEEVLVGKVRDEKINIALAYSSETVIYDGNGDEVKVQLPNPLFKEPKRQQKYMLFLYKNNELNMYFKSCEPYRIEIQDGILLSDSVLFEPDNKTSTLKLEKTKEMITVDYRIPIGIKDTISGKYFSDVKSEILELAKHKKQRSSKFHAPTLFN